MPARLEIALREDLFDAEGASLARKARDYLGCRISETQTRAVRVLTIDAGLSKEALEQLRTQVFTNPVTEISSFEPLDFDADWVIWVGFLPGVKDAAGENTVAIGTRPDEAMGRIEFFDTEGRLRTVLDGLDHEYRRGAHAPANDLSGQFLQHLALDAPVVIHQPL